MGGPGSGWPDISGFQPRPNPVRMELVDLTTSLYDYHTDAATAVSPVLDHLDAAWQSQSDSRLFLASELEALKKYVLDKYYEVFNVINSAANAEPEYLGILGYGSGGGLPTPTPR